MKKNSLIKKFVSAVLSASLAVAMFSMPVMANELDSPVIEEPASPQQVGSLLAGGSGSFSNGIGSIRVFLDPGDEDADVKAGTSLSSAVGSVDCYVTRPEGDTYYLGTIFASSDVTDYMEFAYLTAGTYTFTFEASTPDTVYVYARIYDWLFCLTSLLFQGL